MHYTTRRDIYIYIYIVYMKGTDLTSEKRQFWKEESFTNNGMVPRPPPPPPYTFLHTFSNPNTQSWQENYATKPSQQSW